MDTLSAMRAFVAVADQRGFAAAGRRLGLSQPTMTRLVGALEEHLAVRLLHRTTRSVGLTEAGARYLAHARRILAELAEAEADARRDRSEPEGRFSVAAPVVFGRQEVAPLWSEFLRQHPRLIGSLALSDGLHDLFEDAIDVAIRIGRLDDSSLRVRALGATGRVVVGSPAYLGARGRPASPADLASHDLIQFTSLTPLASWTFQRGARSIVVPIAPRTVTNGADAAIFHAERGGGLALVLSYQVADAVRAGRLEVVLREHEPPALPIQIVHRAVAHPPASVRAFVDHVVGRCAWDFTAIEPKRRRGAPRPRRGGRA